MLEQCEAPKEKCGITTGASDTKYKKKSDPIVSSAEPIKKYSPFITTVEDGSHVVRKIKLGPSYPVSPKSCSPETRENLLLCRYCVKAFSSENSLNRHMKIHIGNSHKCHYCQRLFLHRSHLVDHMRSHTGEKPFKCQQCDKAYTQKGHLNRHMRTHLAGNTLKCMHCMKRFSTAQELAGHIMEHTRERHECVCCGVVFGLRSDLNKHMRSHDAGGRAKRRICSYCYKEFSKTSYLLRHLRTEHVGEGRSK